MSDDPRLQYADPQVRQAETGRSFRTWIILLAVWGVGLIVWAIYLIALGYLALRLL